MLIILNQHPPIHLTIYKKKYTLPSQKFFCINQQQIRNQNILFITTHLALLGHTAATSKADPFYSNGKARKRQEKKPHALLGVWNQSCSPSTTQQWIVGQYVSSRTLHNEFLIYSLIYYQESVLLDKSHSFIYCNLIMY